MQQRLKNESQTSALAKVLSQVVDKVGRDQGAVLLLHGDLGVGKTAFTRAFLRGLGYSGTVKSPTYTLVEVYERYKVNHFDLYRLSDPEELEFIGIEHYFGKEQINLIEWPEKGADFLPPADLSISISLAGEAEARIIHIESLSEQGSTILSQLQNSYS